MPTYALTKHVLHWLTETGTLQNSEDKEARLSIDEALYQTFRSCYLVDESHVLRLPFNNYVLKRLSFGSKEYIEELKLECASFLGQTS